LAALEQHLKEIDSAKIQVTKVVNSSQDLGLVIDKYKSNFEGIAIILKTVISEIKSVNLETISSLSKQTELFNNEVIKLSNIDFENSFISAKKEFLKQFEKDLQERLFVLDEKTINFGQQVQKLTDFDFTNSFKSIEVKVIEQFEKDLQASLTKIEIKTKDIQYQINDLKSQIIRLEAIDLNAYFSKISIDSKNQYEILLKETKNNRIILIIGIVIIIGVVFLNNIIR